MIWKLDQTGSNWIKLAWKSHNKFGVSTARNRCDKILLRFNAGDWNSANCALSVVHMS